jgi:hypothetical protein
MPSGTAGPYDPPAGTYSLFPASAFLQKIPQNPAVNSQTSAWLSHLGTLGFGQLQFAANASGITSDYNYPIYRMASGSTAIAVKVHCTEPWGTCSVEGKTVYVDSRALPEDGGNVGDSHFAIVDPGAGMEYDFWGTKWPPVGGKLTVSWGGKCALSGTGYSGCAATGSGTALSLGIIRASDLLAAVANGGTLPYALASSVKCTDGYISPFTASDGTTAGCPPEGARAYLAMHDSDVNATSASNIVKVLMRTMDEDHYGMFITDIDGGESGFSLVGESDLSYTTFGLPGPFVTNVVPEAVTEGLLGSSAPFNNVFYIQLSTTGIDLSSKIKFL